MKASEKLDRFVNYLVVEAVLQYPDREERRYGRPRWPDFRQSTLRRTQGGSQTTVDSKMGVH